MENCNWSPSGNCLYKLMTATSRRVQNSSAEEKEEMTEAKCKCWDLPVGCWQWEVGVMPERSLHLAWPPTHKWRGGRLCNSFCCARQKQVGLILGIRRWLLLPEAKHEPVVQVWERSVTAAHPARLIAVSWQQLRDFRHIGFFRTSFDIHCNVWKSLLHQELLFQPLGRKI